MTKLPRLGRKEVVHTNKFYQVHRIIADFDSYSKEYYVADYGRKAGVVVDSRGSILLVQQYRLLPNRLTWEIPGGKVEESESFEDAAMRECYEETGVQCSNLKLLLRFHVGADNVLCPTTLFWTRESSERAGDPTIMGDAHEIERHAWIPLTQAIEMVFREEEIADSYTAIALLAYQNRASITHR